MVLSESSFKLCPGSIFDGSAMLGPSRKVDEQPIEHADSLGIRRLLPFFNRVQPVIIIEGIAGSSECGRLQPQKISHPVLWSSTIRALILQTSSEDLNESGLVG
jgi:hypothetical protein